MPDFLLPDLGEGLTEAEIVSWRVAVGDLVEIDQVVADVETAKAVVEVPVPFAGRVSTLHGAPGERLPVGSPLLTVESAANGFHEPGVAVPSAGSGNVLIGYGTPAEAPRRRRGRRSSGRPDSAPVAVISPLVRKLAGTAGLDLRAVQGSGPGGLIRRRDVEAALTARVPAAAPVPVAAAPANRGPRRTMAEQVTRSRREIPEATVWVDVDATDLVAARRALNAADPSRPITILAMLARFVVLSAGKFPELNARTEDGVPVPSDAVHLGFAAQTDRGLMVPVVRDAQSLSMRALAGALTATAERARRGELAPAELGHSTITVNNYGVFGVDGSAAIINHPEVAMIGVGRIVDRPWVVDGALAVRQVTQLTLAFDHRACDGAVAGGFLRYLADCVESPVLALGDA